MTQTPNNQNESEAAEAVSAETPKKKKKYSKDLKAMQRAERHMTRANRDMTRAVMKGISSWEKSREKSARKKKDGAMKDAIVNGAKAYGDAVKVAAKVPGRLAKSFTSKSSRKALRRMFPLMG